LALALAKEGRIDESIHVADSALANAVVRTWILRRAAEVDRVLARHGNEPIVRSFHDRYVLMRRLALTEPKTDW
jgi:hypothetical protein